MLRGWALSIQVFHRLIFTFLIVLHRYMTRRGYAAGLYPYITIYMYIYTQCWPNTRPTDAADGWGVASTIRVAVGAVGVR